MTIGIINPTIQQQWSWIRGYYPWIAQLKASYDDFGRDTGLVDRLQQTLRIGDIVSGVTPDAGIACAQCAPQADDLTPQEWAALHNPQTQIPPFPPPNPYADPHADPWKISTVKTVPIPAYPPYTYFLFTYNGTTVGRAFFECEKKSTCQHGEPALMFLYDFSQVEYIGNITDTPELFKISIVAGVTNGVGTPIYFQRLAEQQHFA